MSETLEYPYSVFSRNELRRVLGNLPVPHPQDVLDENEQERIESIRAARFKPFKRLPVSIAPYPTSRTLAELKALLDEDPASFVGARTQFTGQPGIGPVEGPNYTERQIAQTLTELIDLGYAVENADGSYSMTTEGLAALQA